MPIGGQVLPENISPCFKERMPHHSCSEPQSLLKTDGVLLRGRIVCCLIHCLDQTQAVSLMVGLIAGTAMALKEQMDEQNRQEQEVQQKA